MDKIAERIFKNSVFNAAKSVKYGFLSDGGYYAYETLILEGQFLLTVKISGSDIHTSVCEADTGEPYTLFLVDGAEGSFVGKVRAEYEQVLTDIADKCFDKCVFKGVSTIKLIEYVRKTYGGELEFLWEKFTDNAVWRRQDNKKWYGAILTVSRDKLGFSSSEKVEVLDIRIKPEDVEKTVDNKTVFPGYHMNKKHWISVILDGTAEEEKVFGLLDESYALAGGPHK